MNLPYFIAQRLIKGRREETSFSRPINVIAIIGIAMGLAVMILAVAILTGFKQEIREKVVGFGSHIQIMNFDSNISISNRKNAQFSFTTELNPHNPTKGLFIKGYLGLLPTLDWEANLLGASGTLNGPVETLLTPTNDSILLGYQFGEGPRPIF